MRNRNDLIGKTISGIIAAPGHDGGPDRVWMLQFTDGTHVEFVSPGARRALERSANVRGRRREQGAKPVANDLQLALSVA